ncbi:MAG: DUF2183 domain-containing protein [Bdellovibrionaceae bacterium]|nr:DUF2183 domain-containing protein [Bdellovibrio sp.]
MAHWKQRSITNLDVVYFDYQAKAQFDGNAEVYVWDLDKTYLDTSIDSFSGLFRTIFEKAFTKKNVPGTPSLIRSLSRYRKKHFNEVDFPIFFVSASPPQLESKIFEKFVIDDIKPIGMFYKDNLKNLAPKRFLFLKKQVGYKLQSLLQLRSSLSKSVRMICFGDDSESDATIYNLFSDICSRRHTETELTQLLEDLGVTYAQIDEILRLQSVIPIQDPVEKIYINLATDTDPEYYLKFGRRTFPTYNTFQVALDLVQDQRLSLEELGTIIDVLTQKYGQTHEQLVLSFEELIRRRILGLSSFEMIKNYFIEKKMLTYSWMSKVEPIKEKVIDQGHVYELDGLFEPWIPRHIDYINEYR